MMGLDEVGGQTVLVVTTYSRRHNPKVSASPRTGARGGWPRLHCRLENGAEARISTIAKLQGLQH
jgi:hypothetical protein